MGEGQRSIRIRENWSGWVGEQGTQLHPSTPTVICCEGLWILAARQARALCGVAGVGAFPRATAWLDFRRSLNAVFSGCPLELC